VQRVERNMDRAAKRGHARPAGVEEQITRKRIASDAHQLRKPQVCQARANAPSFPPPHTQIWLMNITKNGHLSRRLDAGKNARRYDGGSLLETYEIFK